MWNDSKVPLQHECSFDLAASSVFRPINRQRCCPPSSHVVGQAKYNEAEERYQQALEICRATRDGAQLQVSVSNNLAELRLIQVRTKYSWIAHEFVNARFHWKVSVGVHGSV